ncbi:MAG: MFS transporter [Balneola sp.]
MYESLNKSVIKKEISILLFCLFLVMIGYGLTLPILPFLVDNAANFGALFGFSPSIHVGLMTGIFPLMQFISAPFWGRWSDTIGRQKILMIGMGGYAISLITFGWTDSLELLYILRVLGGIFSASVIPAVNSWITDVSSIKNRGKFFAWTGGAASLGVIFGPALSSYFVGINWFNEYSWGILKSNSYTLPFMIAGSFSLIAFCLVTLSLRDRPSELHIGKRVLKSSFISNLNRTKVFPILLFALVVQGSLSVFESTFALHAQETMKYSVSEMGYIFMVCGLGMSISQIGLTGFLIDKWGEERLLPLGYLLLAVGLSLLMIMDTFTQIVLSVGVLAFGVALITPSLASLISKVSENGTGERMGVLASISSLGLAMGSFLGAGLYSINIHLPYFSFSIIALVTAVYSIRKYKT